GPGADDTPGALPQVINLPPRKPYDATANGNGNGDNGNRTMNWRAMMPEPVTIHNHIYNNTPEHPVTVNHQAGDITVQPSPPAEVRLEQPITVHPAEVQVPVNVTTP